MWLTAKVAPNFHSYLYPLPLQCDIAALTIKKWNIFLHFLKSNFISVFSHTHTTGKFRPLWLLSQVITMARSLTIINNISSNLIHVRLLSKNTFLTMSLPCWKDLCWLSSTYSTSFLYSQSPPWPGPNNFCVIILRSQKHTGSKHKTLLTITKQISFYGFNELLVRSRKSVCTFLFGFIFICSILFRF